jgi:hypothetical protein
VSTNARWVSTNAMGVHKHANRPGTRCPRTDVWVSTNRR